MGGFDKKVGATLRNWERGDWSKRRDYDYKGGISDPPRNHGGLWVPKGSVTSCHCITPRVKLELGKT